MWRLLCKSPSRNAPCLRKSMSGKGTAISRYRSQRTADPARTFFKDDKCGNVEAAGVSKNNCILKPEPILHVRKRFVIMILSQIRHFCLVCGSIFIAMDLKNGKYCKNKQEKVIWKKLWKREKPRQLWSKKWEGPERSFQGSERRKVHLPIDKVGIKRYDKRKENGVKGHLRYDKITDPKICVYQIHSHYVQLYFCQYGLWYYDGRCRF